MKPLCIVMFFSAFLAACGESSEEAYTRGYEEGVEEGVDEVCHEVEMISSSFHDRLRSDRVCF